MRNMTNRKAFTLIELLVVIAIIAILAAILFPVYSRVKENARAASCRSNLKQIASSLTLYRDGNDGFMPTSVYLTNATGLMEKHTYWPAALSKYGVDGEVLKCLADTGDGDLSYANNRFLFGFLECGGTWGSPQGISGMDFVWLPSRVITIADGQNTSMADPFPYGGIDDVVSRRSGWFTYKAPDKTADTRHLGRGNYAFWDGHVETLRPEQVGRDGAGGGGSSVQQSLPLAFSGAQGLANCANNSPAVRDTEPWWGPGVLSGAAKAGADFAWATAYTDIYSGTTPTNVWGQCGHSFRFALSSMTGGARNDFWGHDPAWHWGAEPDDQGTGVGGSWWLCISDPSHPRGLEGYGSMPTFNRAW